jgi:hypothetical protein
MAASLRLLAGLRKTARIGDVMSPVDEQWNAEQGRLWIPGVLIFDALDPKRLPRSVCVALDEADDARTLACTAISLWEMAMLIHKQRVRVEKDTLTFIERILAARSIRFPANRGASSVGNVLSR